MHTLHVLDPFLCSVMKLLLDLFCCSENVAETIHDIYSNQQVHTSVRSFELAVSVRSALSHAGSFLIMSFKTGSSIVDVLIL